MTYLCITCDGIAETAAERCAHCGTPLLTTAEVHFPLRRGEADATHPLLGASIGGKYRLQAVLGKGGMGTVFRAVHEVSLVPVALKLLHRRYASQPAHREWFLAEARKAGRVSHEHSARIHDVGETDDGTAFIAMELVGGPPLSTWLARGERMAPGVVVEIIGQIARALHAAHEVGVVHRDLSPRNVAVSLRDGRPFVKILDFGIAKGTHLDPQTGVTTDGGPDGFASPAYAAPEHLAGAEVDGRADLYSLGVIAYQALAGRLPVAGRTGAEVASATLAGRIEPLRQGGGVPSRLVRLVNALLAHDPAERPASAAAVGAELRKIGEAGQARGLRAAAVLAAMVAIALAAAALSTTPARFLVVPAGSALRLWSTSDAVQPLALRSDELGEVRLEFAGFDPQALEVELSRAGVERERLAVRPEHDGALLVLRKEQPGWGDALARIAARSVSGPVDVALRVSGLPPLAYTRLRLDDEPPRVALALDGQGDGAALRGATRFELTVEDAGEVARMVVLVEVEDRLLRIAPATLAFTALTLCGGELPGVNDHGPVAVWAEATDAAGNVGCSTRHDWPHCDLRAPEVRSTPQVIPFDRSGARARVLIDTPEPGLEVLVAGPDGGAAAVRSADALGDRIDLVLGAGDGEPPFADGPWTVQLVDRFGNRSRVFPEQWRFEASDARVVAAIASGRAVRVRERLIASDGSPFALALRCNPLYRPQHATLRHTDGGADTLPLLPGADGEWVITVPALKDGDTELDVELAVAGELADRTDGARGPAVQPFRVRTSTAPPRVTLPALENLVFLRELTDQNALALEPQGTVAEGTAWSWSVDDKTLLRGSVWLGDKSRLVRHDLLPVEGPRAPLLRGIALRQGWNVIGLQLEDALGREVEVWRGGRPVPREGQVQRVLEFHRRGDPCHVLESLLRVEFGLPVRFSVRCALPPDAADGIALQLGGARLEPLRVRPEAEESVVADFAAAYEQLAAAAGIGALGEREFLGYGELAVPVRMRTRAGEVELVLRAAPIRSSLVPTALGELWPAAVPPLRGIAMVPSPGPRAAFRDPTAGDLPLRGVFRPLPEQDTRNVGDVYLQRGETTREEYAAIVAAGLERVGERAEAWQRFVHRTDRLGAARLRPENMVPALFQHDAAVWQELLDRAPTRPVTGIDFFQAFTAARLAGYVLADEPDLLRLPLGVELEVAALGVEPAAGQRLNGAPRVRAAAFRSGAADRAALLRWPPTAAECARNGDAVATELGFEICGLDFGACEWVGDLPYSHGVPDDALLREWLSDHARHLQRTEQLAAVDGGEVPRGLVAFFARIGVVRGLAWGDVDGLIDARTGAPVPADAIGPHVPGVTRCHNLPRDGRAPSGGALDPLLGSIGMRLAGGAQFVAKVRAR